MAYLSNFLHRSSQEGCVAKDIEDIFAGRHEDRLALTDLNTIDIRFSPETDHDDERIAVEIDLLGHLHHHAMHHEVGTVDKL